MGFLGMGSKSSKITKKKDFVLFAFALDGADLFKGAEHVFLMPPTPERTAGGERFLVLWEGFTPEERRLFVGLLPRYGLQVTLHAATAYSAGAREDPRFMELLQQASLSKSFVFPGQMATYAKKLTSLPQ